MLEQYGKEDKIVKSIRDSMLLTGMLGIVVFGIWIFHDGYVNGSVWTRWLHQVIFAIAIGGVFGLFDAIIDHGFNFSWKVFLLPGLVSFPVSLIFWVDLQSDPETTVTGVLASLPVLLSGMCFAFGMFCGEGLGITIKESLAFRAVYKRLHFLSGMK